MICGNCYNLLPKLTNESTVRKVKPLIFSCRVCVSMSDMIDSKSDLAGSISELESLGVETQKKECIKWLLRSRKPSGKS